MCTEHGACDIHLSASYDDVPDHYNEFHSRPFLQVGHIRYFVPEDTMARTRKQALEGQIRALADELAALEDRPAEPAGEWPTVTFTIRFHSGPTAYTYAARKANGKWYTTGTLGRANPARTWDALLDWIDGEHRDGLKGSHLAVVENTRPLA